MSEKQPAAETNTKIFNRENFDPKVNEVVVIIEEYLAKHPELFQNISRGDLVSFLTTVARKCKLPE